jgi:hypothetical protein
VSICSETKLWNAGARVLAVRNDGALAAPIGRTIAVLICPIAQCGRSSWGFQLQSSNLERASSSVRNKRASIVSAFGGTQNYGPKALANTLEVEVADRRLECVTIIGQYLICGQQVAREAGLKRSDKKTSWAHAEYSMLIQRELASEPAFLDSQEFGSN